MPFPSKKVKSTKISRLVNDHLHNGQKRRDGSSLVVETGFPTSLVDLFMKNRGKLKKSSKKRCHSSTGSDAIDSVIAGSPASFPSPPAPLPLPIEESVIPPVHSQIPPRLALSNSRDPDDDRVVRSSDGDDSVGSVDAKRASFVFLKLFLVLLIALGTKGLTVGITISAFLLLFLEYVGKHTCGFLNPFADASGVLKLMLQRVCFLFRFKDVKLDEYDGSLLVPEMQQEHSLELDYSSLENRNQEIQIVEANYYSASHVEEIQAENDDVVEGRFRYQEFAPDEAVMEEQSKPGVLESKAAKLQRAKMKLKLKRFFQKKPPNSRKEHEPQSLEIVFCDDHEAEQCHDEGELVITRNSSVDLCGSDGSSEVNEETLQSGLSWRYMVLCVIILIGLIGGRGIAILLTLAWYMLLKLPEKLPRYMKVHTIQS